MKIYKDSFGCTVIKLNESESKFTMAPGFDFDQVKTSWINSLKNLFDETISDGCFNYVTKTYEKEKEDDFMIDKELAQELYDKFVDAIPSEHRDQIDKYDPVFVTNNNDCPVTLSPKNGYNDEKSQGWYHVDAEDNKLNINIHRKLWLDALHASAGTSAFYDENGKVWIIPTKSIQFLHPYKEKR